MPDDAFDAGAILGVCTVRVNRGVWSFTVEEAVFGTQAGTARAPR